MRLFAALALATGLSLTASASGLTQPATQRPWITGIHHIAFRVSDVAAARRFYNDILGLGERAGVGGNRIIYTVGTRQHVALEPGLPAGEDERLGHLAFETADLKAMIAH